MKSFLKYRFPGQSIVEKVGSFVRIENFEIANGFVVSDFLGEHLYQYSESESSIAFKYELLKPVSIQKDEYLKMGHRVLEALQNNEVEKVVFSRVKTVQLSSFDLIEAFNLLEKKYPSAFVYCFQDPLLGIWLGASPENLLTVENNQAKTVSLAGTREKSSSVPWSQKEYREQEIVTEYISKELNSLGLSCIYTDLPIEEFAGPLKHLKTKISFQLQNKSVAEVLGKLHPTPAVCGTPKNKAIKVIQDTEAHNRELYAGVIGCLSKNASCLYVNLRCSKWFGNEGFLFVGGGYTKDSILENEWNETENKSKTLLNVLQTIRFDQ